LLFSIVVVLLHVILAHENNMPYILLAIYFSSIYEDRIRNFTRYGLGLSKLPLLSQILQSHNRIS